jgi:Arginine deiminase
MVGMGERTRPQGIEILARSWFTRSGDKVSKVIVVELPKSRAFMHLDTALTMIDRDAFVIYPYLPRDLRSYTITPDDSPDGLQVEENDDLWVTVQKALELDALRVLSVAEDVRAATRAVGRRQQLPCRSTRSDLRIRAQHNDQHLPAQERHRNRLDRRERARARQRRPPMHDLPDRTRPSHLRVDTPTGSAHGRQPARPLTSDLAWRKGTM